MGWLSGILGTAVAGTLAWAAVRAGAAAIAGEWASLFASWFLEQTIPAWAGLLASLVFAAGGGYLMHTYHAEPPPEDWTPVVKSAEQVDTTMVRASRWNQLIVHDAPDPSELDTIDTVLPEWILDPGLGGGNALPEVTYEGDLIGADLSMPQIPFVAVPMRGETRPTVDVGPEVVTLHAINPRTGGGLTYRYRVPQTSWLIDVEGVLSGAFSFGGLKAVGATQTLGVSHMSGPWTIRLGGGAATDIAADRLSLLGVGEIAVSYEIATW